MLRLCISGLSPARKRLTTDALAVLVYWPLARMARIASALGVSVYELPLSEYRDKSLYIMRNDALDRFGTPLERRFARAEIAELLSKAGFDADTLVFSAGAPFWSFSVRNTA